MKTLMIFLISIVALFTSVVAQADPVLEYEMEKDHNFYHVTLRWYDVYDDYVDVYRCGNLWATFQNGWNKATFYTTRPRGGEHEIVYWVCESGTDICSSPVVFDFKGKKPMQGNNKP